MKAILILIGTFALGYLAAIATNQAESDKKEALPASNPSDSNRDMPTQGAADKRDTSEEHPPSTSWLDSEFNGSWSLFIDHFVTLVPKSDGFSSAWQRIHALSISDKRSFFLAALSYEKRGQVKGLLSNLIYTLAKEDMPRAQTMFEDLAPQDRAQFGEMFLYGWSRGDSKGAWDWLNSVDRSTVGSFLRTDSILRIKGAAIVGMMNDPNNRVDVLELALNEEDIVFAEHSLDLVVKQLVERDIDSALNLLETHPEIADTVIKKSVEYWARTDLPQATNFLMANQDIASAESAKIVGEMMILNGVPESLPQLYDELERPELKEELAFVAAGHSAQRDLNESVKWIDSIDTPRTKRQAAMNVIHKLGFQNNMDTHLQFIETTLGTSANSRPVYVRSLQEWQKVSPDRVNAYVDSLPAEASSLREQLIWQLNLNLDK